ncbi:MAG: LysM peptidoglycan-binding domain-containing protein [Chloroflexi bacterium]|nr:LysM peptidoglycan-binding domain-containing protein [Chloroflexota bacterium]
MFLRLILLCSTLILLAFPAPALAQSNPTPAPCRLPVNGIIVESVTYTLISDCTQTDSLEIKTAQTPSVTLTINGGGHTIFGGTGRSGSGLNFLVVDDDGENTVQNVDNTPSPNVKVIIKNVTFDGNNALFFRPFIRQSNGQDKRAGIGSGILTEGTLEMENVTFTRSNGISLTVKGTASLTNVLFENNLVKSSAISESVKGGLHVTSTGRVTVNNAVFRDNQRSVVVVEKGGRLKTTGCLSFVRSFTHNVHHSGLWGGLGTWSDSSTGPCSGSIGNGGQAVVPHSLTTLDCGLPADGTIGEDAVYTLTQDCVCVNTVTLATGVKVTINANDHRIVGCEGGSSFRIGGFAEFTINRARISGIRMKIYGGAMTLADSELTDASSTPILNYGYFHADNTIFERNRRSTSSKHGSVYYATNLFNAGRALFRDNIFRDNTGGPAELTAVGPGTSIILCGDNVRDDPPPEEGANTPTPVWLPLFMTRDGGALLGCESPDSEANHPVPQPGGGGGCRPEQSNLPPNKNLGAIGYACHVKKSPASIEIWEISPDNQGSFALSVSQSEIEAKAEGPVACSRTGRAAVRVGLTDAVRQQIMRNRNYRDPSLRGGRDILISLGPTSEGKVHHYVIDTVLDGDVLGTVDTFSNSPPCPYSGPAPIYAAKPTPTPAQIYAPPVIAQPPQADGSIVHVVREGDTVWTIGVAYGVHPHALIALNELPERGSYIIPGQELLIRPAE